VRGVGGHGGGAPQDAPATDLPSRRRPSRLRRRDTKTSLRRRRRRARRADADRASLRSGLDSPFKERFSAAQGPVVRRARPLDGLAPLSVSRTAVISPCGEITAGTRTGGFRTSPSCPRVRGQGLRRACCILRTSPRACEDWFARCKRAPGFAAVVEARSLRRL
jgi:hypothetical protein